MFVAEPFERGWGTTLGTALRRALLSSLPGAAIANVQIEGVYHEFSTLPGVAEDVVDILLNLKELNLKMHVDHPKTLEIHGEGEQVITGATIEHDADVEILNPEQHIATLSKEGKLHAQLVAKVGRGYVPAERNREDGQPAQLIPIDSVFSPVRRVNFKVENTRVGQETDYDKLILQVWTNGSISPEDAVARAAKLVKDHLQIFINFEEEPELEAPVLDRAKQELMANLDRSVEELELSVRSYNCLKNANLRTIRDLVQKSEAEMLKTRNFGRKSLNEIKDILTEMNLHLGMNLVEAEAQVSRGAKSAS